MCWLLAFTLYSHGSAVALPGGGRGAGSRCRCRCEWTLPLPCFPSVAQFPPLCCVVWTGGRIVLLMRSLFPPNVVV